MKFKQLAIPTLVLLMICLVATGLLALTNRVTAPIIAELDAQSELKTRGLVLPGAVSYSDNLVTDAQSEDACYRALDAQGKCIGIIAVTQSKGYGGAVRVMVGVDTAGKVAGVKPLILNETPGLGMKAQDESFLSRFTGKMAGIGLVKNSPGENEVQAITGATITSKAMTDSVNQALALFEKFGKEGQ